MLDLLLPGAYILFRDITNAKNINGLNIQLLQESRDASYFILQVQVLMFTKEILILIYLRE